jgi:hypothetical protein
METRWEKDGKKKLKKYGDCPNSILFGRKTGRQPPFDTYRPKLK